MSFGLCEWAKCAQAIVFGKEDEDAFLSSFYALSRFFSLLVVKRAA
jgi:hypothetical protein